jgi:hypothetical protein
MMISHSISAGEERGGTVTRLAAYVIALVVGLGTLALFRREPFAFRTALACMAVVFSAGVIAVSQQNMIGVGLVFAPPFIMLIITFLLPREDRPSESEREADEPQGVSLPDPTPTRPPAVRTRLPLGVARFAAAVLVVALTAEAVHRGMIGHEAGYRLSPHHGAVVDLSETIALRVRALSDRHSGRDDEADGTIDDALQAPVEVAQQNAGIDLETGDESECNSLSAGRSHEVSCDPAER